jgi:hypothetical protein
MAKVRDLEKKYLKVAATHVWTGQDLHWLYREKPPDNKPDAFLRALTDLSYCYSLPAGHLEGRNMELWRQRYDLEYELDKAGSISLDVLKDLLYRLDLLKQLYYDKSLGQRTDAKDVMSRWKSASPYAYASIYEVVGNMLITLEESLRNDLMWCTRSLLELAYQENSALKPTSQRRKLEKEIINIGDSQVWTCKGLYWLRKDHAQVFTYYLQAAENLRLYCSQQAEMPTINDEIIALSADLLLDYLPRLDLLKALKRDQKLNDRAYIKTMMKKWPPTFTSIYEVIDEKLLPLKHVLNSIIESGCQRIAYLEQHQKG